MTSTAASYSGDGRRARRASLDYWRMGETRRRRTLADSAGTRPATLHRRHARRRRRARRATRTPAIALQRHRRTSPGANVDLSGTSKVTLEFWLKWNAYADDDDLAMEFTPNFNSNTGGFLVDPNARQSAASSGSASAAGTRATTCTSPGRAPATGTTTRSCSTRRRRPRRRSRRTSTASRAATRRPPAAPAPAHFANSTLYIMSPGGREPVRRRRPRRGGGLRPRARAPRRSPPTTPRALGRAPVRTGWPPGSL